MRSLSSFFVLFLFTLSPLQAWDFPEIKGWTPKSDVSSFGPENLWQHIDGAAELYLSYGFQLLRFADLSSEDLNCTVNIYDMGSQLNAFGIYNTERGDEKDRLTIGAEAVIFPPSQCLLHKGAFYVKVDVYEGEMTVPVGKELLKTIAAALPGADGLPEELGMLPSKGKIPGSEGYVGKGYLGVSELSNCLFAEYEGVEGQSYQVFVVLPGRSETVKSTWSRLEEKWKPVEYKKHAVLSREIPYRGMVGVMLTDRGIYGVSESANTADLLRKLKAIEK